MIVNKLFTYLTCACLKSTKCFNVKSSTYYFHMKMKLLADFQICITVPLKIYGKPKKEKIHYYRCPPLMFSKICRDISDASQISQERIKETPTKVFSCEISKISKNMYFE